MIRIDRNGIMIAIIYLGPLMCLTQGVPELNGTDAGTLSQTLDNVAYIMPGL